MCFNSSENLEHRNGVVVRQGPESPADQCDQQHGQEYFESQTYSTFSLFNKLPVELLALMLEMALINFQWWKMDHPVAQYHFLEVHRMAQVSKLWKQVILTTPAIWASIHSGYPHPLQAQAFVKSKNTPLTVTWKINTLSSTPRSQQFQRFSLIAKPHIHRIRFLRLELTSWDEFRSFLDNESAPHLEVLKLALEYPPHRSAPPHPRLNPFQGKAVKLMELELNSVPIVWHSQLLKGLRVLSLCNINRLGPTPEDLLMILAANPHLESLVLRAVSSETRPADSDHTVVNLSKLAVLRLGDLADDLASFIIRYVRAPQCRITELMHRVGSQAPSADLLEAIRGIPSSVDLQATKVRISLFSLNLEYTIEEWKDEVGSRCVTFRFDSRDEFDWGSLLGSILDVLQCGHTSAEVELKCMFVDFGGQSLGPPLLKLHNLQRIRVQEGCHHSDRLLRLLAQPSIVEGVRRWPCLLLKTVMFAADADCSGKGVFHMCWSREGNLHKDDVPRVLRQAPARILLTGLLHEKVQREMDAVIAEGMDSLEAEGEVSDEDEDDDEDDDENGNEDEDEDDEEAVDDEDEESTTDEADGDTEETDEEQGDDDDDDGGAKQSDD